jgi:hypothetical protein
MTVSIQVQDGSWDQDPLFIQELCAIVADCFSAAVEERSVEAIVIEPGNLQPPRPRTLYERGPAGEVRIWLSARGSFILKYVYQFAHEFCHVMANIPATPPSSVLAAA